MWEYYHVVLPAKITSAQGAASLDPNFGQGQQSLTAQHQSYTNQLAGQGWEMISFCPVSLIDGITSGIYFVFKRRKS